MLAYVFWHWRDSEVPVVAAAGGSLWGRQMVLGPTPDRCLHSAHPVELPVGYAATRIDLAPLWPADGRR